MINYGTDNYLIVALMSANPRSNITHVCHHWRHRERAVLVWQIMPRAQYPQWRQVHLLLALPHFRVHNALIRVVFLAPRKAARNKIIKS